MDNLLRSTAQEDYRKGILAQENLGPKTIYMWQVRGDLKNLGGQIAKTLRILMLPSMTELKNGADSEVDDLDVWKALQTMVKEQGKIQKPELAEQDGACSCCTLLS